MAGECKNEIKQKPRNMVTTNL